MGLRTFDGSGYLTETATTSTNGVIESGIDSSGTYTVNEDCTGTMTLTIPVPPFELTLDFVIADRGKEFYTIGTTTPSVVTAAGKRVQ